MNSASGDCDPAWACAVSYGGGSCSLDQQLSRTCPLKPEGGFNLYEGIEDAAKTTYEMITSECAQGVAALAGAVAITGTAVITGAALIQGGVVVTSTVTLTAKSTTTAGALAFGGTSASTNVGYLVDFGIATYDNIGSC